MASRSIWFVMLFQVFFIIALYTMLNSRYSGLQQSLNVNIISVARSRNFDTAAKSVNLPKTPGDSTSTAVQTATKLSDSSTKASDSITENLSSTSVTVFNETERSPRGSTDRKVIANSTANTTLFPFKTFLFIVIPILPGSFDSRELIRNTWYKNFNDSEDVMLRFVLGIKGVDANITARLSQENATHEDLLYFPNLKENKTLLTNKTLMLMQWVHANVDFTYLLKCDDDTYVFVKRTITELKKRKSTKGLYYGKIQTKSKPRREGEYWPDIGWDLADTYLPYALGGGYILSSDLVSLIVEDIQFLEWHPNEDTSVGSWLAPYNVERRDDTLICVMFYNKKKSKKCPEYHIMHLFFGLTKEELEKTFIEYSKKT